MVSEIVLVLARELTDNSRDYRRDRARDGKQFLHELRAEAGVGTHDEGLGNAAQRCQYPYLVRDQGENTNKEILVFCGWQLDHEILGYERSREL